MQNKTNNKATTLTNDLFQTNSMFLPHLGGSRGIQGLKSLNHLRYYLFIKLQYLFFSGQRIPFLVDKEYFSWWTMNTIIYRQRVLLLVEQSH